jgi:hypothetical protein
LIKGKNYQAFLKTKQNRRTTWVWRYSEESKLQIFASAACKNICDHLHMASQTNLTIYKTLIRLVLLYGSETQVLTKEEDNRLLVIVINSTAQISTASR